MNGLMKLSEEYPQTEGSLGAHDRSIKNNLLRQRDILQTKLDKINAAIEALNKQPEVAELLETVMKAI